MKAAHQREVDLTAYRVPPGDVLPKGRGRPRKIEAPAAVSDETAQPTPAAVRLAVQLGRQPASQGMTVDEVAADAIELARLGQLSRKALEMQRTPDAYVKAAAEIADRYSASVVDLRQLDGVVTALEFRSGLYSSGYRNLFFIA